MAGADDFLALLDFAWLGACSLVAAGFGCGGLVQPNTRLAPPRPMANRATAAIARRIGDLVTAALTRSHERKGTRPPIRSTAAGTKRMVLSITCLQKCKHPYDAMRVIHNGVNSKHFGFKIHFWVLMVKELMTPILHDRESVSCSTRGHRIEYTSLHGNYRWVGCILWDSARTADS